MSRVRRVAIVTPGFAADCLETLEEIGVENAGYFREAGGERFAALPCLHDSAEGMAVIETVARRELSGWAGQPWTVGHLGTAGSIFDLRRCAHASEYRFGDPSGVKRDKRLDRRLKGRNRP